MTSEAIPVLLHVAANVEAGLDSRRGGGFQTVQASEALLGTEDLRLLETVAPYYEVTSQRRAAGEFPTKESFFALPSGRLAVGRTVDWGTSASGRAGNFLARHLVLERDALRKCGMDPFCLLDAAWPEVPAELEPAVMPPLPVVPAGLPGDADLGSFPRYGEAALSALALHMLGEAPFLLLAVGEEAESRRLLRALFVALPEERRARCFFSTHFYRACTALGGQFRLATVRDGSEAPPAGRELTHLTLESPGGTVVPGYAGWLARRLRVGDWSAIHALNRAVAAAEGGVPDEPLPDDAEWLPVFWERAGTAMAPALAGRPGLLLPLLAQLGGAEARRLAEALLLHGSPEAVCGNDAEAAVGCMTALKRTASGAAWKAWSLRWKDDPLFHAQAGSASGPKWAFWRR